MAKPKFQAPKGMRDLLPEDMERFRAVERAFRETCRLFGYREIRTPHLEATELFKRTVGETTDIVEKEMYTLTTKGGDELALRPENTAGVVRAYLQHGMHRSAPLQRFFYWGEMFRHESKQKKRHREFTQAGVECIGSEYPEADAEVIALAVEFFRRVQLERIRMDISTIGCPKCRGDLRHALVLYYERHKTELCAECRRRLEHNPLRLLDCKEDACRQLAEAGDAPTLDDKVCPECLAHFQIVQQQLRHLDVGFVSNHRLVRGLDYYTRSVFEFFPAGESGRQDALGAGGRYDGLAELLGGPHLPAVGFSLGVDRIALALKESGAVAETSSRVDVCFATSDSSKYVPCLQEWALKLRREGIACSIDLGRKNLKNQMRAASKEGARLVVVMGADELARNCAAIKNMETGEQRDVPLDGLVAEVRGALDLQREDKGK